MSYKDKWNKNNYQTIGIRFPVGTTQKFRDLFGNEVSFNGWVVQLVTSRLLMKEWLYPDTELPNDEQPKKDYTSPHSV